MRTVSAATAGSADSTHKGDASNDGNFANGTVFAFRMGMRTNLISTLLLSLFVSSTAAYASPKAGPVPGQAKAGVAGRPKLLTRYEDPEYSSVSTTYQMPSGRKIEVETHGRETTLQSNGFKITTTQVSARDAGERVEVRSVENLKTGTVTSQRYAVPAARGTLVRMENMRSQGGEWTDVERATYSAGGREHEMVLAPGGSQVEERPVHIDEAAVAKRYLKSQATKRRVEKAFQAN